MTKYFFTNVFQSRDKIHCWGYGNGKRFHDEIEYKPYLFVPHPSGEYRTILDQPLVRKDFASIKAAREFLKMMDGASNADVYGITNFSYQFLNDEFPGRNVEFDPELIHVISLDIEVSSLEGMPNPELADQAVTAITLARNGKSITWGTKACTARIKDNTFVLCKDESELLLNFLEAWGGPTWYPDIVTGWNIDFFDIPYLINRVRRIFGDNMVRAFSPIGTVYPREVIRGKTSAVARFSDRVETIWEMAGITSLDYMALYKKFATNARESYSLAFITQTELGESKLEYKGTLDDLYKNDYDTYIKYNVRDAILVERLEAKLNYIKQVFAIAYRAKVNYIDTMTTSRPWDAIIHAFLLERKIAIPQAHPPEHAPMFEGAYVKDPQIGLHHWVVSFDLTSLYPSIISQQNISPDTFVKQLDNMPTIAKVLKDEAMLITEDIVARDATLAMNGTMFRRDKRGFIPELVDEFIAERAAVKKRMIDLKKGGSKAAEIQHLDNYQNALKILTNGLYGALGMKYFRWFDVRYALAVTATGQLAIRWIEKKLNSYLNKALKTEGVDYVIAMDTDSCYLKLDKMVTACGLDGEQPDRIVEFLDKVCVEKLEPYIERCYVVLGKMLNVYTLKMKMKREAIANKGIWRGKKMYILNVWNNEGVVYPEPRLVIHGIEAVRSSTPKVCRDDIKDTLKIIMNQDEKDLQAHIKIFREKFITLPYEDISFPRSVNGLVDYYDAVLGCKKGTPLHVRGALTYNSMLDKLGLDHKYPKIIDKGKIRYAYLTTPNPARSHVIAVPDELPPELGLDQYIDRNTQFEKSYLNPIKSITDVIGWDLEKKSNLKAFFKKKELA